MAYNNNGGAFDRNANTNFWATMMSDAAKSAANTWIGLKQNETNNRQIQNNYDVANNQIGLERQKHQFELDKNKHQNMVNENTALSNTNATVSLAEAAAKGKYWRSRIDKVKTDMNNPYAVKYYEIYEDLIQKDADKAEQTRLAKEKSDYNNAINGYSKSLAAAASSDILKNPEHIEAIKQNKSLLAKLAAYNDTKKAPTATTAPTNAGSAGTPVQSNGRTLYDFLNDMTVDASVGKYYEDLSKMYHNNTGNTPIQSAGYGLLGPTYGLLSVLGYAADVPLYYIKGAGRVGQNVWDWFNTPYNNGGK